jgi:hypothetical protein
MRPFNVAEQKRILTAGACLTCHTEKSEVMWLCLHDIKAAIKMKAKACTLPAW